MVIVAIIIMETHDEIQICNDEATRWNLGRKKMGFMKMKDSENFESKTENENFFDSLKYYKSCNPKIPKMSPNFSSNKN